MGLLLLPIFIVFVLVVSFVGLLVGIKVARWRHSAFWGIGAFFLVWAAVLSPEVFVHAQLRYLCKTQGGVRVYETISEPKTLFIREKDYISGKYVKSWQEEANSYLKDGYEFIENRSKQGELYRFWRNIDGQVKRTKINRPASHYEWSGYPRSSTTVNKYIWLYGQKIIDRSNGKTVAVYKDFGMAGGPLLKPLLSQIRVGTGSYCDKYDKNFPKNNLNSIYPNIIQQTKK